jgi:hypothetical protein
MTPAEIIAKVLDTLERPDLEAQAYNNFNSALKSAHSIEVFQRDLVELPYALSEYAVVEGAVGVPVPGRLRKILRVFSTKTDGSIVDQAFAFMGNKLELRNYFGFKQRQTYTIFANVMNIAGLSANADVLNVQYAAFPELAFDPESETWITDSWIAVEMPEVIEAYLQHRMASITEDANQINTAEKYIGMCRADLIRTYAAEIVEISP